MKACARIKVSRRFFADVSTKAANVCDEPRIPRQRQPPRRLDEGSQGHSYSDSSAYYRQQYCEAIDNVVKEHVKRRFDQQSLKLPRKIDILLGDGAAGKNRGILQEIRHICCGH